MVDILTDMSFSVDVLDYCYKYPIQSQEYDLIIGFGDAYESIFYQAARPTCILYATGAPLPVQNYAETMRIKAINDVKGINLFPDRVFDRTWPCSDILSDAIISVTSGWAKSQFEKHHGNVYSVNITSLSDELVLSDAFIKNKDPRQFVWFSGAGAAHKGLDLCLEVFKEKPDLTLHVVGNLEQEPHFMRHYQSFLHLNNIHYHGFIDVCSDQMSSIMANTTFVILPSCSEGAATSVLTCMQWQCIPVITPQCGIVYPEAIVISDPSIQSVEKAVACCLALSQSECNARMRDAARWVAAEHNSRRYKTSLRNALSDILEEL